MATETESSTPEFNPHELAGKLEWLAKDIRGKVHGGDLTIDYVADELMDLVLKLDILATPDDGPGDEFRGWARLELQAERAAQEIERRKAAPDSALRVLWRRIFASRS